NPPNRFCAARRVDALLADLPVVDGKGEARCFGRHHDCILVSQHNGTSGFGLLGGQIDRPGASAVLAGQCDALRRNNVASVPGRQAGRWRLGCSSLFWRKGRCGPTGWRCFRRRVCWGRYHRSLRRCRRPRLDTAWPVNLRRRCGGRRPFRGHVEGCWLSMSYLEQCLTRKKRKKEESGTETHHEPLPWLEVLPVPLPRRK